MIAVAMSYLWPADQNAHNFVEIQRTLPFSPDQAMIMPQGHHWRSNSTFPSQKGLLDFG
jgi:hypothetical protein